MLQKTRERIEIDENICKKCVNFAMPFFPIILTSLYDFTYSKSARYQILAQAGNFKFLDQINLKIIFPI